MKKSAAKPESMKDGERVYLLHGRTLELAPGHSVRYPAGYYQPSEVTEGWVRDGLAVPESEWEARHAEAAQAAKVDPVMHLAGPRAPVSPAVAPAGNMWAAGPKGSQKPAVEPVSATAVAPPPQAPAVPAAEKDSADVQTSANEKTEKSPA